MIFYYFFYSYGSPAGNPLGPTNRVQNINPNINPRRPNGATQRVYQTAGSNPQPSYIKPPPEALVDVKEPEKIVLSEPGYGWVDSYYTSARGIFDIIILSNHKSKNINRNINWFLFIYYMH